MRNISESPWGRKCDFFGDTSQATCCPSLGAGYRRLLARTLHFFQTHEDACAVSEGTTACTGLISTFFRREHEEYVQLMELREFGRDILPQCSAPDRRSSLDWLDCRIQKQAPVENKPCKPRTKTEQMGCQKWFDALGPRATAHTILASSSPPSLLFHSGIHSILTQCAHSYPLRCLPMNLFI